MPPDSVSRGKQQPAAFTVHEQAPAKFYGFTKEEFDARKEKAAKEAGGLPGPESFLSDARICTCDQPPGYVGPSDAP